MRVFHVKVFDDIIEGSDAVMTSPEFDELLGSPTSFVLVAVVSNVSGTDPTLTVTDDQSPDRVHWVLGDTPLIDGASISAVPVAPIGTEGAPMSNFVRFRIALGGTSTLRAHVTIWVTGRDRTVNP